MFDTLTRPALPVWIVARHALCMHLAAARRSLPEKLTSKGIHFSANPRTTTHRGKVLKPRRIFPQVACVTLAMSLTLREPAAESHRRSRQRLPKS
jgi:hypothetical protein